MITYPLAGWLGASAGLKVDFAVLGMIAVAAVLVAVRLWPHPDPVAAQSVNGTGDKEMWRPDGQV